MFVRSLHKYGTFLLLFTRVFISDGTLHKSDKSDMRVEKFKHQEGPISKNVTSRNLVSAEPKAKDIILGHGAYHEETGKRNFEGKVLGYVTPWNGRGYDVAKIFAKKFTHISPVWFQMRKKGKLSYDLTGKQDIDPKWLSQLKKNNYGLKITPRVLFSDWSVNDFTQLFTNRKEQNELINILLSVCKAYQFNGIVLEIWLQIGVNVKTDVLTDFINYVAQEFYSNDLEIILVVPPVRGRKNELFTAEHFDKLSNLVGSFSLMTYDYSNPERPGPNSPITWMEHCVKTLVPDSEYEKRSKILLGLNFYGNDYTISGGGPIVGTDFLNLLKHYKGKLKFDNVSKENFFEVRSQDDKHLVFYPTLYSLFERIELAKKLGTGISIWELGQGLNYFYDLF